MSYRIQDLPDAGALDGNEIFEIQQGASSRKLTLALIQARTEQAIANATDPTLGTNLVGDSRYGTRLKETLSKFPYYLSLAGLPSGGDDTAALQAIIDVVSSTGGGRIVFDSDSDYLVYDTILVKSNVILEWTHRGYVKLMQASSTGAVMVVNAGSTSLPVTENVIIINPHIDGNNLGYPVGNSFGENGLAGTRCRNVQVYGGEIKNCREGSLRSYGTGGKAIQFEFGVDDILVMGTTVRDSTIGMETGGLQNDVAPNDFRTFTGVRYTKLIAYNCERLISINQPFSPPNTDVRVNSAVISGIVAYNCGRGAQVGKELDFGAIILDRVNNVTIEDVEIFNDGVYGNIDSIIRFIRGENNTFRNITLHGQCNAPVSHIKPNEPAGYAVSGLLRRNIFDNVVCNGPCINKVKIVQADISGTLTNNKYNIITQSTPTGLLVSLDTGTLPTTNQCTFAELALGKTMYGDLQAVITAGNAYPVQTNSWRGALRMNTLLVSFGVGSDTLWADTRLNLGANSVSRIGLTGTDTFLTAGDFANDAAAQTGGVALNALYFNTTSASYTRRRV